MLKGTGNFDPLVSQLLKHPPAMQETWVGKIPWRRERLHTPVSWSGELHGLYSPWGHKELDMTEQLSKNKKNRNMCFEKNTGQICIFYMSENCLYSDLKERKN